MQNTRHVRFSPGKNFLAAHNETVELLTNESGKREESECELDSNAKPPQKLALAPAGL